MARPMPKPTGTASGTGKLAGAGAERRKDARTATIFAYGKLFVGESERLCQIRNISADGVRIEARNMPAPGEPVMIEMRGLAPSAAVIVWQIGDSAGLAFETSQDLQAIFELRSGSTMRPPRSPRFALSTRIALESHVGRTQMDVVDISLGGVKLAGNTDLEVDGQGIICLGGPFEQFPGQLRWKLDGHVGFRFNNPLHRDDLLNILACRS